MRVLEGKLVFSGGQSVVKIRRRGQLVETMGPSTFEGKGWKGVIPNKFLFSFLL